MKQKNILMPTFRYHRESRAFDETTKEGGKVLKA